MSEIPGWQLYLRGPLPLLACLARRWRRRRGSWRRQANLPEVSSWHLHLWRSVSFLSRDCGWWRWRRKSNFCGAVQRFCHQGALPARRPVSLRPHKGRAWRELPCPCCSARTRTRSSASSVPSRLPWRWRAFCAASACKRRFWPIRPACGSWYRASAPGSSARRGRRWRWRRREAAVRPVCTGQVHLRRALQVRPQSHARAGSSACPRTQASARRLALRPCSQARRDRARALAARRGSCRDACCATALRLCLSRCSRC